MSRNLLVSESVAIGDNICAGKSISTGGSIFGGSTISVYGTANFGDKVEIAHDVVCQGKMHANDDLIGAGNVFIDQSLKIVDKLNVNGDVFCGSGISVADGSFITGPNGIVIDSTIDFHRGCMLEGSVQSENVLEIETPKMHLGGDFQVTGASDCNDQVSIRGTAIMGSDLSVFGITRLAELRCNEIGDPNSGLQIDAHSTDMNGNLRVYSDCSIDGSVSVGEYASLADSISVKDSIMIGHNGIQMLIPLIASEYAHVGSSCSIHGTVYMGTHVSINSQLVSAAIKSDQVTTSSICGEIMVLGPLRFTHDGRIASSISISDRLTCGSSISVRDTLVAYWNTTTIMGTVVTYGKLDVHDTLLAQDAVVISSGISVHGPSTFYGDIAVMSNFYVAEEAGIAGGLSVTSRAEFSDSVSIESRLYVDGRITAGSLVELKETFLVDQGCLLTGGSLSVIAGGVFIGDSLEVSKELKVGSELSVAGESKFSMSVSLTGNLMVSDGTAHLYDDLKVDGNVSIQSKIHVGSSISIDKVIQVASSISLFGGLRFGSLMELYAGDVRMISGNSDTHTGYLHGVWVSEAGVTVSDRRFKHDVTPIDIEFRGGKFGNTTLVDLLASMRPVAYSLVSQGEPEVNRRFGFIAQELEEIIPDLVYNIKETGTKSVLYEDMIAILTSVVQEQYAKIASLEEEMTKYHDALAESTKKMAERDESIQSLMISLISLEMRLRRLEVGGIRDKESAN